MIQEQLCPICGKQSFASDEKSRGFLPFCGERCKNIDLLRWSQGRYAIVDQLSPAEAELLQHDPDIELSDDS